MFVSNTRARANLLASLAAGSLAALLAACSGGAPVSSSSSGSGGMATGSSCTASSCGSVMMTLTDAQGDLLSYVVTLTSLQLQTKSGAVVETLPASTKIDFTQLVDLSELVSAGQIPPGEYTTVNITLDYTGATITADDGSGNAVPLQPVNADGSAITTLTATVQLDDAHGRQRSIN